MVVLKKDKLKKKKQGAFITTEAVGVLLLGQINANIQEPIHCICREKQSICDKRHIYCVLCSLYIQYFNCICIAKTSYIFEYSEYSHLRHTPRIDICMVSFAVSFVQFKSLYNSKWNLKEYIRL